MFAWLPLLVFVPAVQDPPQVPKLLADFGAKLLIHYRDPKPEVGLTFLTDLCQGSTLDDPWFQGKGYLTTLIGAQVGLIAKDHPHIVRRYEALYETAPPKARKIIAVALHHCGDAKSLERIDQWLANATPQDDVRELKRTRFQLADPQRKPFRKSLPVLPIHLDVLWTDFFVTGDWEPVARILDVLDQDIVDKTPVLAGAVRWSVESNLNQHPRLVELAKQHLDSRPPASKAFLQSVLK